MTCGHFCCGQAVSLECYDKLPRSTLGTSSIRKICPTGGFHVKPLSNNKPAIPLPGKGRFVLASCDGKRRHGLTLRGIIRERTKAALSSRSPQNREFVCFPLSLLLLLFCFFFFFFFFFFFGEERETIGLGRGGGGGQHHKSD